MTRDVGEVERVRGLLAELEARQRAKGATPPSATSCPQGAQVPAGETSPMEQAGEASSRGSSLCAGSGAVPGTENAPGPRVIDRRASDGCAGERGAVFAWAEVGERRGASSFSAASSQSQIFWNGEGPEGEAAASRSVPRSVAKAFGTRGRWFGCAAELARAIDLLASQTLWERLVAFASARERSAAATLQKLRDEGFGAEECTEALARAQRLRIVDDARYAASFIRSKTRAGWGRSKIETSLRREGVDLSQVDGYPDEFFAPQDEEGRARALAARRPLSEKDPVNKLVRHLVGKGFSPSVAFKVARERVEQERGDVDAGDFAGETC